MQPLHDQPADAATLALRISTYGARSLRAAGANVIAFGRSSQKAERLLAQDTLLGAPGSLRVHVVDFGLMVQVVAAVERMSKQIGRIDLLLHAVGVIIPRAEYTEEGLEIDFAVSYLSRFTFLEEAHRRGLLHPGTRMVNVAASAPTVPRFARVEFSSLAEVESRTGMRGHGQAQLANDLLTAQAPRHYGITTVGYGPGAVDTNIRREIPALARALLTPFYARATRRPDEAARDILAALTDPDLPPASATFRNRRGPFPAADYILDVRRQRELRSVSQALLGKALDTAGT